MYRLAAGVAPAADPRVDDAPTNPPPEATLSAAPRTFKRQTRRRAAESQSAVAAAVAPAVAASIAPAGAATSAAATPSYTLTAVA